MSAVRTEKTFDIFLNRNFLISLLLFSYLFIYVYQRMIFGQTPGYPWKMCSTVVKYFVDKKHYVWYLSNSTSCCLRRAWIISEWKWPYLAYHTYKLAEAGSTALISCDINLWMNTGRIRKSAGCGSWFTNSSRVLLTSPVVYQPIDHINFWSFA